jgi:hypothetical protein
VDYRRFKSLKLRLKKDISVHRGLNEYGMELRKNLNEA